MLDTTEPIDLATYNRTVTVEPHGSDLCLPVMSDRGITNTICPNKHFLQVNLFSSAMCCTSFSFNDVLSISQSVELHSSCASATPKQAGAGQ